MPAGTPVGRRALEPSGSPPWAGLVGRARSGPDQRIHRPSGGYGSRPPTYDSTAYPGLITSVMNASRSSNGRNDDFIALTVSHCRSAQP